MLATNGSLLYFSSGKTQNNASVDDQRQQVQTNYWIKNKFYKNKTVLKFCPKQPLSKTAVISSFFMDEIFIISGFVAFGMLIWLLIRAEIQARKNLKKWKK